MMTTGNLGVTAMRVRVTRMARTLRRRVQSKSNSMDWPSALLLFPCLRTTTRAWPLSMDRFSS